MGGQHRFFSINCSNCVITSEGAVATSSKIDVKEKPAKQAGVTLRIFSFFPTCNLVVYFDHVEV